MGMYTELCFNARLKQKTPENVINILKNMLGDESVEVKLPRRKLFKIETWRHLFALDTESFASEHLCQIKYNKRLNWYTINIMCTFKNYNNELNNFLDWIMRYVDANNGDFLGYSHYEDSQEPKLIYKTH